MFFDLISREKVLAKVKELYASFYAEVAADPDFHVPNYEKPDGHVTLGPAERRFYETLGDLQHELHAPYLADCILYNDLTPEECAAQIFKCWEDGLPPEKFRRDSNPFGPKFWTEDGWFYLYPERDAVAYAARGRIETAATLLMRARAAINAQAEKNAKAKKSANVKKRGAGRKSSKGARAAEYSFKYHPEPLKTKAFKTDRSVVCACCGKETAVYYDGPFYSEEEVEFLCPDCIASGKAAEKFDGEFIGSGSLPEVDDEAKVDELTRRTPCYSGWQEEQWVDCCGDFCAFVGCVDWAEIEKMGIEAEIEEDIRQDGTFEVDDVKAGLSEDDGSAQGYLFKCLHCGKYRLLVDFD